MRISRRLAAAALALALGLATAGPVRAQTTSASVSGMVRDSQGGALPGATVTLTRGVASNPSEVVTAGSVRLAIAVAQYASAVPGMAA